VISSTASPDELPHLQLSIPDYDDVNQEAELLKLQGIVPNKRIIRQRLALQAPELLFNLGPDEAEPIYHQHPTPSLETMEQLIDWTLQQAGPVQEQLFRFLDDPEAQIDETLRFLEQHEVIRPIRPSEDVRIPLAEIMRNSLPRSRGELATLIKEVSPSTRRPEATVRQFLRRGLNQGTLRIIDDVVHAV
jgi:hypothetical protein